MLSWLSPELDRIVKVLSNYIPILEPYLARLVDLLSDLSPREWESEIRHRVKDFDETVGSVMFIEEELGELSGKKYNDLLRNINEVKDMVKYLVEKERARR